MKVVLKYLVLVMLMLLSRQGNAIDFDAGYREDPIVLNICYNSSPEEFIAVGYEGRNVGDGTFHYWEISYDGISWAKSSTNDKIQLGNLTQTTYLRFKWSNRTTTIRTSQVATINVTPDKSGSISQSQSICHGAIPARLNGSATNGEPGDYSLQWQMSTNNSSWSNISGATAQNYQPGALTQTTYYRRNAIDHCGAKETNTVTITVRPALAVGSISANQTICYNASPARINGSAATGGAGSYSYQWQKSTNGTSWTNISGATAQNYQPGALTQTTHYRRNVADSQCGNGTSNTVTITVRSVLAVGSISANQTICYNATPARIDGTQATGGAGSPTYQWQISTNGTSWTNISGATAQNYQPGALTQTTHFRRNVADSQCGNGTTNTVTITVRPKMAGGTIGSNHTICFNTPSELMNSIIPASGGSGSFTYQWQNSLDGIEFADIPGVITQMYQSENLTQKTYFKRKSINDCGVLESNVVIVNVNGELTAGQIGADEQIANNTVPSILNTETPATGGTGSYAYQWQYSYTLDTWININNATGEAYQPPALTQTTYYRRKVTSGGCGTVNSNIATKTVFGQVTGGTIGTNQTLCYDTAPEIIENIVEPSGGSGSFTYIWEISINGTSWSEIVGFTENSYQPGRATEKRYYRRKAIATTGGSAYSNVVIIDIYPNLIGAKIGSAQLICYNSTPDPINIVTNASGGTGSYTYQWEISSSGTTWTEIAGATNPYYEPESLKSRTFYRLRTINQCTQANSNSITINVSDELRPGTIGENQIILYNGTPQSINVADAPSGGDGAYTYQWQQSINGTSWTNIPSATSESYQPQALQQTTNYRRLTTSALCGTKETNTVTIIVTTEIVAGTIGNDQVICSGVTPARITTINEPSGGLDIVYTKWEQSTNGTDWSEILGATMDSYQPAVLTQTRYYRKIITAPGINEVATNIVTITVEAPFIAPEISSNQTICQESRPNPLEISSPPIGGTGSITYQWQQSLNGVTWGDITEANSNTYEPEVLTQNTHFRLKADNICGNRISNSILISLYPVLIGGSIDGSQAVAHNGTPAKLIGENPSGGTGSYSYQWQKSTDNINWFNIIDSEAQKDYQPTALTQTTYFKRIVSSGSCGETTSNVVAIDVLSAIIPGVVMGEQTICYNDRANALLLTGTQGGNGIYTHQWQWSSNNSTWTDIEGAIDESYAPQNITANTFYRCIVTSVGTSRNTNSVLISVRNPLISPMVTQKDVYCKNEDVVLNVLNDVYQVYKWYDNQMNLIKEASLHTISNISSNQVLYVKAVDSNGCNSALTQIDLTVDNLKADFTQDTRQVEQGFPVSFTNTSVNAESYEWNFYSGEIIREVNAWHYYNVATPGQLNYFDVTLTAVSENGCSDVKTVKDAVKVIPFLSTSLAEVEKNHVFISNPVANELVIVSDLEITSFQVYSISGQLVLTGNEKTTNVSHLPTGVYIVNIGTIDNALKQIKIVKK